MSALAQFSVTHVPDTDPPLRQFRLACGHGETTATLLAGDAPTEEVVLTLLRGRHALETRCGCGVSATRKEARA